MSQPTILIVDDSASMRQILALLLKQAGFATVAAKDGFEALELLDPGQVLAIVDYNMPNLNGIELIRRIRSGSVNRAVPILMVTTETEESRKQEARQAGATGWITKPFDQAAFVATVRRLVGPAGF